MANAPTYTFTFWLVFAPTRKPRITMNNPRLERDERAMRMSVSLPRSLWTTPTLSATVKMDDPGVPQELQVDVSAIADAIRSAIGVDVDIAVNLEGKTE